MPFSDPVLEATQRVDFCLRKGRDHLNLAGLGLAELPQDFVKLTGLRYLDLTGNQLTSLPDEVCTFTDLRWLGLNFNRLSRLPERIGDLRHLERFYLRQNHLESIPESIGKMHALVEIDLNGNRLKEIGEGWFGTTSLEVADFGGNPLQTLPSVLGSLERLRHVTLSPEQLPADMRAAWNRDQWPSLKDHLLRLDRAEVERYRSSGTLQERHLDMSPQIVASLEEALQTAVTMGAFHRSMATIIGDETRRGGEIEAATRKGEDLVCTGKLIFIGDAGMGKTCLLRALKGDPFQESSDSTQGMEISRLRLRPQGGLVRSTDEQRMDDIVFHCWDMGGQEMYHHTHQIFFSDEAVYLGVIQAGERASVRDLRHWLDLLRTRTQKTGIHVIVTITRSTGGNTDDELERGALQRDFPSFVFDFIAVNSDGTCKLADGSIRHEDGLNIAALRVKLAGLARETAGFARLWLPGWVEAMEALTRSSAPYLGLNGARSICAEHGVAEADQQELLLATAHEVGLLLWKRHMGAAREYVVLSPDWLSHAVARVLVRADKHGWTGPVTRDQLREIWGEKDEVGGRVYHREEMPLLVELMEAYEISYRGHAVGAQDEEIEERFLIASMVGAVRPANLVQHWPAAIPAGEVEAARFVSFELQDGELGEKDYQRIIGQLIVRLHRFSLGVDDIQDAVHWKSGLLIRHASGARAQITVGTRELEIRVRAGNPQGLLDIIMDAVGSGEKGVIRNAAMIESVACWDECRPREAGRGRWPLRALQRRASKNETHIDYCGTGTCERRLSIERLLHPLAPEAAVDQKLSAMDERTRQTVAATERIEARLDDLLNWKNVWRMDLSVLHETLRGQNEQMRQHMAQMLLEQGNNLLREMRTPGADGPRLFSIVPVEAAGFFSTSQWVEARFRLSLWCEHSLRPLCLVEGEDAESRRGVHDVVFRKSFLQKALPVLKWIVAAGVWVKGASALLLPGAGEFSAAVGGAVLAEMTLMKELLTDLEKTPALPPGADQGPVGTEWPAKFSHADTRGHGIPFDEMTVFALKAREEYKKHDPLWGGMKQVFAPQGILWVHPRFEGEFQRPRPMF